MTSLTDNKWAPLIIAFLSGFIFSLGLSWSGMTQPQKVIGFLDLLGDWNPSLIFVMVGAIMVHASYFFFIKPRFPKPLFIAEYHVPKRGPITLSLILGSVLFGVGWGLAGYCPGPAISSLASLSTNAFVFVLSMVLGMKLYAQVGKFLPFQR